MKLEPLSIDFPPPTLKEQILQPGKKAQSTT